jgi:hypothetical protein
MVKAKAKKTKLNVSLLRKVQAHILEEPRRYEQNTTIIEGTPGKVMFPDYGGYDLIVPSCGTIACIGGWVQLLGMKRPFHFFDQSRAAKLLGIRSDQAHRLFNYVVETAYKDFCWPKKFSDAYKKAKTPRQRVKIAVARIEHFIATNGEE